MKKFLTLFFIFLSPMVFADDSVLDQPALNKKLFQAVAEGNTAEVALLLKQGADVHALNAKGMKPLHVAVLGNQPVAAELLLANGADPNAFSAEGMAPVHYAAQEGDLESFDLLVKYKADIHMRDRTKKGWKALAIHHAAGEGHLPVVHRLLELGEDINVRDAYGDTPLIEATAYKQSVAAKDLVERGADLEAQTKKGLRPIHFATAPENYKGDGGDDLLEFFLEKGAFVDAQDERGQTPLHMASRLGKSPEVRLLLKYKADVNIEDKYGEKAIGFSVSGGDRTIAELIVQHGANVKDISRSLSRVYGTAQNQIWDVIEFAIEKGADPNIRGPDGDTLLIMAAMANDRNRLEFFIRYGVDPNAQDQDGLTALHWAAKSGNSVTTRILLKNGATPNIKGGWLYQSTPLHSAVMQGRNPDTVSALLEGGADLSIKDSDGKTALDALQEAFLPSSRMHIWIKDQPHKEILKLLMAHKAKMDSKCAKVFD